MQNNQNVGFAAACNQGTAASTGRHLLLLNPDTEVQGDALSVMASYLDANPKAAVVGPRLLNPDGSTQSSRRRFPTARTFFLESTLLQRYFPRHAIIESYYYADCSDEEPHPVDWLVGACLMVRRDAYCQVGGLDEGFFMYSEELDWCKRMKSAGWEVHYLPSAQVVHWGSLSADQDLPRRHIHFQESKLRYIRKYHGPLLAAGFKSFLFLTYCWQLLEEGGKFLLGHKRPLRRGRMSLLVQVLRSGFHAPALRREQGVRGLS
jgi:GT2 family glycosyltransferase